MSMSGLRLLVEDRSIGQITHLGKVWYLILGNGIPGFCLPKFNPMC